MFTEFGKFLLIFFSTSPVIFMRLDSPPAASMDDCKHFATKTFPYAPYPISFLNSKWLLLTSTVSLSYVWSSSSSGSTSGFDFVF